MCLINNNMNHKEIIDWLLQGDVALQYQVQRDLLGIERKELQERIAREGWGAKFLSLRHGNGYWGRGFYQPKWTSTHYTLLDLRNLEIARDCVPIKRSLKLILRTQKAMDGGINPARSIINSDVCINGMALNYLSYFRMEEYDLQSIVDFILSQQMPDGGFNCHSNRKGARHSSMHTTLSILEGILEYKQQYTYRLNELLKAEEASIEFLLMHRLFKSDKSGEIINKNFLALPYPSRWRYDILRALDYFHFARHPYDTRMQDALDVLSRKRSKNGRWKLQAHHPGQLHFNMEIPGQHSRWNTLRALRVLKSTSTI